jgi:hypothetical protein
MILQADDLYETVCVLQGRIAESRAKAKLLQQRLEQSPDDPMLESAVEGLEIEMLEICQALETLDESFSANIFA